MAKSKKRYGKKKHKAKRCNGCDTHHLCYQRRHWRHGATRALRLFHYCLIQIPKATLHRMIHEYVGDIPEPTELNAQHALEQLKMLERYNAIHNDDPIEKRLNLLAALFDCCDQPTADGFRKQLEIVHKYYSKPP